MKKLLKGNEKFISIEAELRIKVSDFWSWAYSELLNNIERGALAEFLVLSSFKLSSLEPRIAWQPFNLTSPSGRRIEVKAASYIQSWSEDYYARILFDIGPKSSWNPKLGISPEKKRNSDIYVFCVYTSLKKDDSILNLDLWDFYVLPTSILDESIPSQKTIGIQTLLRLGPTKVNYSNLGKIIESVDL